MTTVFASALIEGAWPDERLPSWWDAGRQGLQGVEGASLILLVQFLNRRFLRGQP